MTPAETLRAAAARLRGLADAATPGNWAYNDLSVEADGVSILNGCCDGDGWIGKAGDGELIAAFGPTTVPLIVDLLEREADVWDEAAAKLPAEAVAAVLAAPSCVTFTALAQHVIQEQS